VKYIDIEWLFYLTRKISIQDGGRKANVKQDRREAMYA
jgi:hypothetical protein